MMSNPTGTIAVNPISQLSLGGNVTFDVTYAPSNLDHKEKGGVRIQILAYDDVGNLIYAEAGHYDMSFLLGGSMSVWFQTDGPAHCRADLYYWDYPGGHQTFVPLTSCTFEATGR